MIDQTRIFQLERLYLAVTAHDGSAPSLQLLARTPDVRPEHIAECRRAANLMPPDQRTDAMPGSLGIFRGETIDFIIAKAQVGPNGFPAFQYLLAPAAAIRWLGGNIRVFESYATEPIPQFTSQRTDLPPFVLDHPEPPDKDTQTDDLLALMDLCKNNLKVIGGLLGALVQAMGLGIINAPLSLHDRITFVQGLMTLLPAPARTAITFATSVTDPGQTNTQIKFLASDVRPARHVIYDWAAGKVLNEPPEDIYSKFIMAQLRLDTSLVLEHTEKLARTAVWRAMRKDDMANALAWVSRRASVDSALQNGQPVDRSMVAGILREDPTLTDELRIVYSRHLLAMALALDDPSLTDIIPAIAAQNHDLADAVNEQLRMAAAGDQGMAVYHLVERWLSQAPMGVDVSRWRPLLGAVVLNRVKSLLAGESAPLVQYLESLLTVPASLQLEPVIAEVIDMARPRGAQNADVARAVFLLAVTYLPAGALQTLLGDASFAAQLPEPLRDILAHLTPEMVKAAPPGLLAKGSEVFGPERQPIILARMVDWALYIRRLDLIDMDALRGMVKLALSPYGSRFDVLCQQIVEDLTRQNVLKTLDLKAPQYLVELSLARGAYPAAIRQLEIYQNTLYRGTKQEDLAEIVRAVFSDVPLSAKMLDAALQAMQDSQLKPVARANAYIGALEAKNWSAEMEGAAQRLTAILVADPRLIELIGVDPVLRLLKAHSERKDAVEALRTAGALVEYSLTLGADKGPDLINQIYPLVNWSTEVTDVALEMLRIYARRAPLELAKELPHRLGTQHGEKVERSLDAAYRLRLILGGADFDAFSERAHAATLLLIDMAATYHPSQELPPIHKLRRTVEGMPGGLSDAERQRLSQNLNTLGVQILKLAQANDHKWGHSEPEGHRIQLFKSTVAPATSLDALRWISGHLGQGKTFQLKLERNAPPHLLGNRSVNMLLRETDLIMALFDGLLAAFPEKDAWPIDNGVWAAEVDSVWAIQSLYKQRQIQPVLIEDLQLLAQAIKEIGDKGHERSFQPHGYGRQLQTGRAQPRSVIDALRWVSGYFGRQHS